MWLALVGFGWLWLAWACLGWLWLALAGFVKPNKKGRGEGRFTFVCKISSLLISVHVSGAGVAGLGWLWLALVGVGWLWLALAGVGWLWLTTLAHD